jgi:hypothetical protein
VKIPTSVIASEAKQSRSTYFHWIASSPTLLAMTKERFSHSLTVIFDFGLKGGKEIKGIE